ncbi:hypothetical protein [Hymenobacter psychrophilus]|uniref:Uncharacterized protein n=1 Tax=Hymenobacter psychrophilus TaxID=651662 RepID=A0A1H3LUJ3_9BACT|nr:hypothetical protein [Hymenobacter psychrophilus]SDY67694.1 hypothetical protein SAMN04488069_111126 [Hymenobacter psychrophilus]
MSDTPNKDKQNNEPNKIAVPKEGDPLFTLHHAQAEAAVAAKNNDDTSSVTNEYMTEEQQQNVDEAMVPRDSQGFIRGVNEPGIIGSNAGDHN